MEISQEKLEKLLVLQSTSMMIYALQGTLEDSITFLNLPKLNAFYAILNEAIEEATNEGQKIMKEIEA